ncbi:non-structural maintenance of chromosomes element 4 homolog A-like [Phalaenopsis equestris]|uniref:non-structural maintenance of chromosomes element 4 homolog A-like n=1 Tax=Phalaenopsis equestris TaxID=78828 RepID=UPI0009E481BD|nr:non-structural maintenance of chromosomes element 4 homolog A-like [Phalaenopsis equestris]
MVRPIKRERSSTETTEVEKDAKLQVKTEQGALERRALRSRYLAVKNLISNERDDITRQDSKRFKSIITEVEALHENVKKPREQVADAETLLDIASTLAISVRSQNNEGVTPSDLVTAILKKFGCQEHRAQVDNSQNMVSWEDIGLSLSHIFTPVPGCCTMIGPMSNEIKQRKPTVCRKRTKPTERTRPEEIDSKEQGTKTDTDSNMATMFDILKKKRRVRLENLLFNRFSFAQTVENLFALSFLVKDGRAEITVDDSGFHLVSPKNAPTASAVASGVVSYHHFVFRFDYKDWKAMMNVVRPGEELMPHRNPSNEFSQPDTSFTDNKANTATCSTQPDAHTTPIRKLTRNRGLIIQEDSIVEDSLEKEPLCKKTSPSLKGKRLIDF